MVRPVLDSSAVLALILREDGWEHVSRFGREVVLSTVNYSEVVAKLTDRGASEQVVRAKLSTLRYRILAFEEDVAFVAGRLRERTKHLGLSFADRACLAIAQRLDVPAVTADRAWAGLDIGIRIELIR